MVSFIALAFANEMDVRSFVPAAIDPDARDLITVQRPGTLVQGSGYVGGMLDYSHDVVVATDEDGRRWPLVEHLGVLNLMGGYTLHKRLRLDVVLPVYGFSGTEPVDVGRRGLGFGDARLGAMISLFSPDEAAGMGFALVPHVDLPTGRFDAYFGRERLAGGGVASVTFQRGPFTVSGEGGVQIETRSARFNLTNHDSVIYGAGINWMAEEWVGIGAEVSGRYAWEGEDWKESPVELIGHARVMRQDATLIVGGGIGLNDAVGAPAFRAFIGGGFGARPPEKDSDDDGLFDSVDACPFEAEVVNGLQDDDGCADVLPEMRVRVTLDGKDVWGAELEVTGPRNEAFQTGPKPVAIGGLPGTRWQLTGSQGACLKGTTDVVLERTLDVEVPLVWRPVGEIEVMAFDGLGELIEGATIEIEAEVEGCAEDKVHRTTRAPSHIPVGQGKHTVYVKHAGVTETREVTVVPGHNASVMVVFGEQAADAP